MCEIALQDDIMYLKSTTTINTFREDSSDLHSQSSQSSESSLDLSATKEWETKERKDRIMDKIQTAIKDLVETEDDEYIKTCWEDLESFQE
ncbi:hypothetical protein G6F61_011565 [Rhizopus arrhizus]|nr:hypothetical protein G6F61_011565 [Rhizopus arrhizus]